MVEVTVLQLKKRARNYWFLGSIMEDRCICRKNHDGVIMVPVELYDTIGTVEVSESIGMSDEEYAEHVYKNDQFNRYPLLHKNGARTASVSDVFAITRNGLCNTYFVDSIGWTKVRFVSEEDWKKLPPMPRGFLTRL